MFVKDTHRHPHKKLLQNKGKTKFTPPPITTHNKILPNLVGKESFTSKHKHAQRFVTKQSFISNDTQKWKPCQPHLLQKPPTTKCHWTLLEKKASLFAITHTNMQTLQCDSLWKPLLMTQDKIKPSKSQQYTPQLSTKCNGLSVWVWKMNFKCGGIKLVLPQPVLTSLPGWYSRGNMSLIAMHTFLVGT